MLVYTTLYEIALPEHKDDEASYLSGVFDRICNELTKQQFQIKSTNESNGHVVPFVTLFSKQKGSKSTVLITVHSQLVTLDYSEEDEKENVLGEYRKRVDELHCSLASALPGCKINRATPIIRGRKIWNYSEFGDGRIIEDNYKKILFQEKSVYQDVAIVLCEEFGNTLILNGSEDISEKGDTYTSALLAIDKGYNFTGKTILILGGGDGAALNQLRKFSPAMVTMVEIDEIVLKACRKYLRSLCGDCFDNYSGENYQIIVGDCLDYLRECCKNSVKFDYVISDITDVPIETDDPEAGSPTAFGDVSFNTKFFMDVFNLSLQVLQLDGAILTHIGASSKKASIDSFLNKIKQLDKKMHVDINSKYVPMYRESWTFCQMKLANGSTQPNL